MADNSDENNDEPSQKYVVKYVGGPKYDFANLPNAKTKSGRRRRSFHRRKVPQHLEDSGASSFCEDESQLDMTEEESSTFRNQCVGEISSNDSYFSEVCRANAAVPVGLTFMAFAVLDFDVSKGLLKEDSFVLVERSLHNFGNTLCWVYRCSCDINRSNYILSLNVYLQGTLEELNNRSKPCNHCIVVERFICVVEAVDGTLPESVVGNDVHYNDHGYFNTDNIFELPCSKNVVCTCFRGEYAFVGSDQHGLKCLSCKYDTHSCSHVSFVQSKLNEDDESFPFLQQVFFERPVRRTPSIPVCLSKLKIMFTAGTRNLRLMRDVKSLLPTDESGSYHIMPGGDNCVSTHCHSCSSLWSNESAKEKGWLVPNVKLYLFNETVKCNVFYRTCSNPSCEERENFDGGYLGILNMGRYLLSHEVLRDYMHHFLIGSCTLQTYHQVWIRRLTDAGAIEEEMPSYNQLRYAWYSFLDLLDIDYTAGSTCSECGQEPEIVVCDATTVAFRKTMVLRCDPREERVESSNVMIANHRERVMISSNPCRKLMMKIANNANLTDHQFTELVKLLTAHCSSVVSFLNWISATYENFSDSPSSIKALVRAIAASSPVCGLIRPNENLHGIIEELISGENVFSCPAKVKVLHEECPVLFAALHDLPTSILPLAWRPMFQELLKKSMAPFICCSTSPTRPMQTNETDADALSFFPTLQKRRLRNFYAADAARRKEEICTKKHPGHSFFLPGIFTLFCPHGNLRFVIRL